MLVFFLILEEVLSVFPPLRMMFAVGLSYMAFIMLRYVPSMPTFCRVFITIRPRDSYRLKVRGWKKIFHAKRNQKKAGVAILISDNINFKIKTITRDKEGHYIMIKG